MIGFRRVTKSRPPLGDLLTDVTLELPAHRRIAIFGADAAENALLLRLIAGITLPTYGRIERGGRVSFPTSFSGGLAPDLTVRENVAHAAQLYGASKRELIAFVGRTARLGEGFDQPFEHLSRRGRALVTMLLAYGLPFDVYLVDRAVARGDPAFRTIAEALFWARSRTAGIIVTTQNVRAARDYCEVGAVLHKGRLVLHDSLEDAISAFESLPPPAPADELAPEDGVVDLPSEP